MNLFVLLIYYYLLIVFITITIILIFLLFLLCTKNVKTQFTIEIFGVGYNGPKKDSLHRDFVQGDGDKGKWVVHAEQNLLLFRCIDDVSQCELYSTHSPCIQCSGLVRAMGIKKVRYLLPYRPPIDLHSDRRAVQFVDDVLLGLVEAQAEQASRRLFQGEGSQQDSQYCKL